MPEKVLEELNDIDFCELIAKEIVSRAHCAGDSKHKGHIDHTKVVEIKHLIGHFLESNYGVHFHD